MNQRLATCFAALTVLVLFGFPKAGIYIGNIPLTFSYMLVGMAAIFELVCLAKGANRKLQTRYAWLGLLIGSLALLELACFRIYGMKSFGVAMSVLVSTLAMPVLAILMTQWLLRMIGIDELLRYLRLAMVPVLFFGLASFLVYNVTGQVIGIPFITTTGSDITTVAERHNLRGPIIKMYSTYNNGNILGINLLIWGPIAALSATRAAVSYRMLCVLTLSRSVWAGLIALELISAMVHRSYRRIYQASVAAIVLGIAVVVASWAIGRNPTEFLLDKDLGGRVTNLQNDLEVISSLRIGWDSESVPAAAWLAFGPVGLTLLTMIWLVPIVSGGSTKVQIAARISLFVYLMVAVVEGAFILVPTQAVYWFVAAIAMTSQETEMEDQTRDDSHRSQRDSLDEELDDAVEPLRNKRFASRGRKMQPANQFV